MKRVAARAVAFYGIAAPSGYLIAETTGIAIGIILVSTILLFSNLGD
jgi:hypothetical protein